MELKMSSITLLAALAAHIYMVSGLGCFQDNPHAPDFPYFKDFGREMETMKCFIECRNNQNFRYAALQGTKCFCGDDYPQYPQTTGCTTNCAANRQQNCGGHNKNHVYDLEPYAKGKNPTLKYINDGKQYKLNCEISHALLSAEYKIDFIVERKTVYSEILINNGPRLPGSIISANMPAEKIASVMGKKLRCRMLSRYIAPHKPTTFEQSADKDGNTAEILIGVQATRGDDSPITAAHPLMLREGVAASVMKVKLTLPPVNTVKLNLKVDAGQSMTCPYTGETMDQVSIDTCQLTFTQENYNINQQVTLQAVEDYKDDGQRPANINFEVEDAGPPAENNENPFVNGGTAGTANMITNDFPDIVGPEVTGSGQCNSQNDPHMKTFDGRRYDCQIEGEFILYKHTTLPFEVRAFYKRCNRHAVCNCAVAARVGDDVIVVDKCGATPPAARKPITVNKYSSSDNEFAPGFSVSQQRGGMTNIISLPNGARVKILWNGGQFLNVYMNPGSSDRGQTEGLCGKYDGRRGNDLTKQGGGVVPASRRPNAFSLSWRVTSGSMYNGLVPTGSVTYGKQVDRAAPICSCLAGKEGKCDPALPAKKCEKPGQPIVDPPTKPVNPGPGEGFGPVDPNFKPEPPTWPTDTGITKVEAEQFCDEFIKKSPAHAVCKDVGDSVADARDNCVNDILLSGVKTWAQEAVEGMKEECTNVIDKTPGPTLPPAVFCLNDCSGNGVCGQDGTCKCNVDWGCEDCSCAKNSPPSEVSVDPVCCMKPGMKSCNSYTVTGRFDKDVQYNCKAKSKGNGEEFTVAGQYVSFDQLKCSFKDELSTGQQKMTISVGDNDSKDIAVGIYNPLCMSCAAGVVNLQTARCLIDGQCFKEGQENPDNKGEVCDSTKDVENWTVNNPCEGFGCTGKCTVENDQAVCTCPDSMEVLNGDGKTCDKPCDAAQCADKCSLEGAKAVCSCTSPTAILAGDKKSCMTVPPPTLVVKQPEGKPYYFDCDYKGSGGATLWYLNGELILEYTSEVTMSALLRVKTKEELIGGELTCGKKLPPGGGTTGTSEPITIGLEILCPSKQGMAPPPVTLNEGDDPSQCTVRPTVPVRYLKVCFSVTETGDAKPLTCEFTGEVMEQVVLGTCCLEFNEENWNQKQTLLMQAVEDFKTEAEQAFDIKYTWSTERLTTKRQVIQDNDDVFAPGGEADVPVIAFDFPAIVPPEKDTSVSQCDPHMRTFDGKRYDNQIRGEFIYYRHTEQPYEVRTYYKQCTHPWYRATCNCAVAVRAGDDVVVIDKCGGTNPLNSPIRVRKYTGNDDKFTSRLRVTSRGNGREYEVSLPNGALVNVRIASPPSVASFLNLRMNAGRGDQGKTEGLVGNYDGNAGNDFRKRDGTMAARANQFSLSWRIDNGAESMYSGKVPADATTLGSTQLCSCQGVTTNPATCNKENTERCVEPTNPVVVEPQPPNPAGPIFPITEPEIPLEPEFPTPGGITEQQAKDKCKELFDNAAATAKCPNDNAEAMKTCIDDVKLSDGFEFGQASVETFKEDCKNVLIKNPDPELPNIFCPNDCSGNGNCIDNICNCNAGFGCDDCSCGLTGKLNVALVTPCCDVSVTDNCNEIEVSGEGFEPEWSYFCSLVQSRYHSKEGISVRAQFKSFDRLVCKFPAIGVPQDSYVIRVRPSRVGDDAALLPYSIYTSECITCDDGVSEIKEGTCFFGGKCRQDGEITVEDPNLKCDATKDPTKPSPTKECIEGEECLIDGECIPDGTTNPDNNEEKCDSTNNPGGWTPKGPCELAGCSHGCRNVADAHLCTCPAPMVIGDDKTNCECPANMKPGDDPDTCVPDCKEGEECFIDGACVPEGTTNPDNAAEKCDSTTNPEGWTPKEPCEMADCSNGCVNKDDTAECTCPGPMVLGADDATCECPANMKPGDDPDTCVPDCKEGEECFIDGACVPDGTTNPDNAAEKCDSTKNPEGWTPKKPCEMAECSNGCVNKGDTAECTCPGPMVLGADDATCKCPANMKPGDDQDTCVPDCKEGEECFIDGECIPDGTTNPDNAAEKCDSTKNPEGWTPKGPCEMAECSNGCVNKGDTAECTCPGPMVLGADEVTCECPANMKPGDDQDTCVPLRPAGHPCAINNGGCGAHICVPLGKTSTCLCKDGYKLINLFGKPKCIDVDECKEGGIAGSGEANCEHECENTEGSYRCLCPEGELLQVDGQTCEPEVVDPCDQCANAHGCEHHDDKTVCTCRTGWQLAADERTCIDVDECKEDNGGCVLECYNEPGAHKCQCDISCQPGYVQEGDKCVGACTVKNGGCSHICDVNDGEVECSCPNAGRLDPTDEKTCKDPCPSGTGGGCEEICKTSELFHITCQCTDKDGTIIPANDDGSCPKNREECEDNEVVIKGVCVEKCTVNNGGCDKSADCSYDDEGNTQCNCPDDKVEINDGSCHNECPKGFEMDMNTGDCDDINECKKNKGGCVQNCVNTEGSYRCECIEGELDLDGKSCTIVDPCKTNKGGCEHFCVHVGHEKYKCECKDGYNLNDDKHSCDSKCDTNNGGCRENSQCELTDNGDVRCPCEIGMFDEDDQCVHPCDLAENICGDMICEEADTGDDDVLYRCRCPVGEVMNLRTEECEDGCKTYGCDGTCINVGDGTYRCTCEDTEVLNEDGKTCDDKNECEVYNGQCIAPARCVNDVPGHHCECDDPLELDTDKRTCIDYDACKDNPCDHGCEELEGKAFVCTCRAGYVLAEDDKTCLEKCKVKNGGCAHNCDLDHIGNVVCECREGYRLGTDGKSCDDINECVEMTHKCDDICKNTPGSYECACSPGTELHTDGKQCLPVDPCKVHNGGCSNTCDHLGGKAVCTCPGNMELKDDKQTCRNVCDREDFNGCEQRCDEDTGDCLCNQGWELAANGKQCDDIDECKEKKDDCDQICINVVGSFECSCGPGYAIDPEDPSKCNDINECKINNGGCRQLCTNMPGSYMCECDDVDFLCADGYTRDPATNKCHANADA